MVNQPLPLMEQPMDGWNDDEMARSRTREGLGHGN